jgi:hypothetical protein
LNICLSAAKLIRRSSKSNEEDVEEEEHTLSGELGSPRHTPPDPLCAPYPLPVSKPWESKKSGKLTLKKAPPAVEQAKRRVLRAMTEEEEDFQFLDSGAQNRPPTGTKRGKPVDLTADSHTANEYEFGSESAISPEIVMKRKSRVIEDEKEREDILDTKHRMALRGWLNEYRKRLVGSCFSF